MKALAEITTIEEDMDYVIENKAKLVEKYTEIFVNIESNR